MLLLYMQLSVNIIPPIMIFLNSLIKKQLLDKESKKGKGKNISKIENFKNENKLQI